MPEITLSLETTDEIDKAIDITYAVLKACQKKAQGDPKYAASSAQEWVRSYQQWEQVAAEANDITTYEQITTLLATIDDVMNVVLAEQIRRIPNAGKVQDSIDEDDDDDHNGIVLQIGYNVFAVVGYTRHLTPIIERDGHDVDDETIRKHYAAVVSQGILNDVGLSGLLEKVIWLDDMGLFVARIRTFGFMSE